MGCRDSIELAAVAVGSVCLCAVVVSPAIIISAFCHRGCGESRVFTADEFQALVTGARASGPGSGKSRLPDYGRAAAGGPQALLVDGEVVYRDE